MLAWSKGVKKGVQCRMYGGVQLMRGTVLHAFYGFTMVSPSVMGNSLCRYGILFPPEAIPSAIVLLNTASSSCFPCHQVALSRLPQAQPEDLLRTPTPLWRCFRRIALLHQIRRHSQRP